jgi:hypothetical protein
LVVVSRWGNEEPINGPPNEKLEDWPKGGSWPSVTTRAGVLGLWEVLDAMLALLIAGVRDGVGETDSVSGLVSMGSLNENETEENLSLLLADALPRNAAAGVDVYTGGAARAVSL